MFKIIILIFLMSIIYYFYKNKIKIKWSSFFKKGIDVETGKFGVYCYCGKQGSTKTMSVVKFLYDHSRNNEKIYCNMLSIDKNEIDYIYIKDLEELLELRTEHDIIIFYDEIFSAISKHERLSKDVLEFLSQMRKRRITLLTTCQEWRLLPLDFRLYVRYQINCSMKVLPFFKALSIKKIIDGDNIKWSDELQDFTGDLIETTIWHCEKFICKLYDTYETIGKHSNYSATALESQVAEELERADKDFWEDIKGEDIECQVASESETP